MIGWSLDAASHLSSEVFDAQALRFLAGTRQAGQPARPVMARRC